MNSIVVAPYIMRIYSGNTPEALFWCTSVELNTALRALLAVFPRFGGEITALRLHTYPRFVAEEIFGKRGDSNALTLTPTLTLTLTLSLRMELQETIESSMVVL